MVDLWINVHDACTTQVMAGIEVFLIDVSTGSTIRGVTDGSGSWNVGYVLPGQYIVTIAVAGYYEHYQQYGVGLDGGIINVGLMVEGGCVEPPPDECDVGFIVKDTGGGALAGAAVSVIGAGLLYEGVTNSSGIVNFFGVPLGYYDWSVSLSGFDTMTGILICTDVGDLYQVNVVLGLALVNLVLIARGNGRLGIQGYGELVKVKGYAVYVGQYAIIAVPDAGHVLAKWAVNGVDWAATNPIGLSLSFDTQVEAYFEEEVVYYTASVAAGVGGFVDWGAGPQKDGYVSVLPGTAVAVTALPDDGYDFSYWLVDDVNVGGGNPRNFTVDHDGMAIRAVFTEKPIEYYTINFVASTGGLVDWGEGSKSSGSKVYPYGATVSVTAVPDSGYTFREWLRNGVVWSSDNPVSFTVTVGFTLTANFDSGSPPTCDHPRTYASFSNYTLKAETWEREWVGKTEKHTSGKPMPTSTNLRYSILYTGGTMEVNHVRIRYNGEVVFEGDVRMGEPVSGEVDVTGKTREIDEVRIGLRTYIFEWDQVSFSVWVDYCYAEEPTDEPEPRDVLDWPWYYWVAGGLGALALMMVLTRGDSKVIVVRE